MVRKFSIILQKTRFKEFKFYLFASSLLISTPSFASDGLTNYTVSNNDTYNIGDSENINLTNNGTVTVTPAGSISGTTTNNGTFSNSGIINDISNSGAFSITNGSTGSINNLTSGIINSRSGSTKDVTNYGTINFNATNSFNVTNEQNASFTSQSGSFNGAFNNSGTANISNSSINGSLTNNSSGTFTTNSMISSSVENYGALNLLNMATVLGGVVNHSGTVNLSGQWTSIFGTLNMLGGTFKINNGNINALSGSANGSLEGLLTINRAQNTLYSGSISGSGTLSISSGTQSLSGQNSYTGQTTVNTGAALHLSGSIAGNLTNNSKSSNPTIISVTGKVSGNLLNTGYITVNGTVGGSVINSQTGSLQASGGAVFNRSFTNSGSAKLNNASLVKGGLTNTAGGTFALADSSEVLGDIDNSGSITMNTDAQALGNIINKNKITIDSANVAGAISNTGTIIAQNTSQIGSIENANGTATFSNSQITGSAVNDAGATFTISGGSVGSVVNNGTMTLANNNTVTHDVHNNAGTITLDGNSINGQLYSDGGSFVVTSNGASVGSLSGAANGAVNGLLHLMMANNTYSGTLSGSGGLEIDTSYTLDANNNTIYGKQILDGNNSYAGNTDINSGTLVVNGNQSTATGNTTVGSNAALSGTGTLGGNVTVEQGGSLLPGDANSHIGTFSILKNLTLENGSSQYFYIGQADVAGGKYNSLVAVGGDLSLGGTLHITANSAGPNVINNDLEPGLYRLYTYGGALSGATGQILSTSSLAQGGTVSLQTAIDHQINLIVSYGPLTFWDGSNTNNRDNGSVDGGSGVWTAQNGPSDLNWTNKLGSFNGAWNNGDFVVYAGSAGTVTVQDINNGQDNKVIVNGMQFANNDGKSYRITGDDLYAANQSTTIRVGDGTTSGASVSAILDTVLNDQYVAGGTSLLKTDLGTLVITKDQTYRGATTLNGGILQLGDGGTTGALAGSSVIHNNATLAVDRNDSLTLAQTIDGTGGLAQVGTGTTVLTADNSYTGDTTISQGTLEVDGSIASSPVTAFGGSILRGTGVVGSTIIAQGATLAPTGAQGSLTVQGNLQMDQNATLALEGNNQLSGKTMVLLGKEYQQMQSGFVNVTGSTSISGNMVVNVTPATPMKANEYYTIISSGSGFTQKSSTFQSNLTSIYSFLSPSLYYNGNDLDLLMSRNQTPFASVGGSRNERETAQMLDGIPQSNSVVQAMESLDTAGARRSMNALSGELHASARTALIQDSLFVRQAVMDRLDTADCTKGHVDGTLHTASLQTGRKDEGCLAERGVLWGQAYGSLGHNGGDGNAASMHHATTGFIMGVDAPIMENAWRIGAMLSYGRSMFDVGSGRSSSGHSNNVTVGGYAGTHWGALSLKLGASYTWDMLSLKRNVSFPGYANRLSSSYLGGTAQGFGELGYQFRTGHTAVEPFANVAYVNLHTNGYHEHGGASALQGRGMDTGVTFSTFGVKASSTLHAGKILLVPHGSLAYRHTFGLTTPTAHTLFAGMGNGAMDIAGVPLSVNAAVIDAGLTARLTNRFDVGLSYIGQYGNQSVDSGIKASVRFKF